MKITIDTNILVRAVVQDNALQAKLAIKTLSEAQLIVIPITVLCELVWVLKRGYKINNEDIIFAITSLVQSKNAKVDQLAVEAGLDVLRSGGDFADGTIAHEGNWLGAKEFVSFDKKAVGILQNKNIKARLLC